MQTAIRPPRYILSVMEKLTKVNFTNLDKILYPELELSKSDVIQYYIKQAPNMLPFLEDRALVRNRYPDGIHGESFYERDAPLGRPDWLETFEKYSKTSDRETEYILCNDLDSLLYLANLGSIELHIPLSRVPETGKPDIILFDLDPEPPAGLMEAVEAAFMVKDKLDDLDYTSYLKVSGKKGIHVVMHVEAEYVFEKVQDFVHSLGKEIASDSDKVVSERSETNVPGTVLIDYPQNSERAAMIAPYSLRAEKEATISAPVPWSELANIRPYDYNIYSMDYHEQDPWEGFWEEPNRLGLK